MKWTLLVNCLSILDSGVFELEGTVKVIGIGVIGIGGGRVGTRLESKFNWIAG